MSYPRFISSNTTSTTATTTHTVNLPATPTSGDLLVMLVGLSSATGTTLTFPAGWSNINTNGRLSEWYRVADGTEGATISVTSSGTQDAAWICLLIRGHGTSTTAPAVNSSASATSVNPDPPLLNTGGGNQDYYAIALYERIGNSSTTAYPSGYTEANLDVQTSTTCGVSSAGKGVTNTPINPGAFTQANSLVWRAATIAIFPGSEGGHDVYTKELTETASLTQTVMNITVKPFSEATTIGNVLERVTTKILAQTVSLTQSIMKILVREFSESATADDTLIKIPRKECEESVSITSGLVKIPKKIFSLSVSLTERFFKFLTRELTETATLTADVDKVRLMIFTLTISLTSSLGRVVVKIFGLSISLTEVFQKFKALTVIVFDESISLSISLVKITRRILIESLSISDTLIKNLVQVIRRSLTNLKALRRPRILLAVPRQRIILAGSRPTIIDARKDETMVVHEFEKQTEEQYPKGIDFKTVLQTGESIVVSGTTVTAENIDTGADSTSSMLTGGATISGSQLLTTMAENGGNDLENHKIRYKAKTNLGNIYKDEMICRIRNN